MSTTSPSWYIPGEGKQPAGPFTVEQIVKMWQVGQLRADAVCWREGMPQWLPLSRVEPFASTISSEVVNLQEQGTPPSVIRRLWPPVGQRFLPPQLVVPLIGVGIIGVLGVLLTVALSLSRGGYSRGEAFAVADIIGDYATRLKQAYNSPQTDVQRQEAVTAAVGELKTSVEKRGSVAFTGAVAEIISEGAMPDVPWVSWKTRNRWGIVMSAPQEFDKLVRDGTCTFGSKVWVELDKKDALSIKKGDTITIRGPVSYAQGSVFGGENCVAIQVWPNSKDSVVGGFGMGNLGLPHTIVIPVSKDVTCSVSRFKSLRVHTFMGE